MTQSDVIVVPFAYSVSETRLDTFAGLAEHEPQMWSAICDWCRFHDIAPERVPVNNTIVRNVKECRVEYTTFVFDEQGRVVSDGAGRAVTQRTVSQGEAPPLAFPDLLWEVAA